MIKTGIYSKKQLVDVQSRELALRKEKKVSITLYEEIIYDDNADELAEIILNEFSDERGAYKRTYVRRFEIFDSEVIKVILSNLSRGLRLIIHDMGVSDARTSVDFFKRVILNYNIEKFYASDFDPKISILEEGKTKVVLSRKYKILEITRPPFVFNIMKRDSYRHYPLNHLIRFFIQYLLVPSIKKKYLLGKIIARDFLLFCPKALTLSRTDERFELLQHDLLKPILIKGHIIRAMNVLNPSYFSDLQLKSIVENIYLGLLPGGLFITGSNQKPDTLVSGAVYRKIGGNFEKIWQSGDTSPIEAFILRYRLPK